MSTLRKMNNQTPNAAPAAANSNIQSTVSDQSSPREMALKFTGSTGEYFRLWIVNICLTLFTFGIYSAWAKVRKKRYFYSHTILDETPFQYLGQPIPILKGRIIAAALFVIWYVATHFFPSLMPFVIVIALVIAPWVIVRAAAFNARYSAYRNMRFHFSGSYLKAVKVMYGWAIVTLFTLGIAFSWWYQRMKRFMLECSEYGGTPAQFSATGKQFFKTYFLAGLLFIGGIFAVSLIFGLAIVSSGKDNAQNISSTAVTVIAMVLMYTLYAFIYAYAQTRIINLVWNHTRLGPLNFISTISVRSLLMLYFTNAVGILASFGFLIPWATIRTLKYRADHLSISATGPLTAFTGSEDSKVRSVGAEVGDLFDFDMSI